MFKSVKTFIDTIDKISAQKSKNFSGEGIEASAILDHTFAPKWTFILHKKIAGRFERNCLKQGKISFACKNGVKVLIIYELDICHLI